MKLNIRELTPKDCSLIIDYWKACSLEYLKEMGADIDRFPDWIDFEQNLRAQCVLPYPKKSSYALVWELDGIPSGHTNVNQIEYGKTAKMHLHLWQATVRRKGVGQQLVKASLKFYFENLNLEYLICEPYSLNPAPNKTLAKAGFEFIKSHRTVPGALNFEQVVNTWRLSKESYQKVITL